MERLPIEILNGTFILLHQRDKIECMLVCRQWALLINKYSLFHTIRVDNMKQLDKVLTRLRQEPEQKNKVKRLLLDLYAETKFEMNMIPTYFPNLCFLGSTDTDLLPTRISKSINTIEHLTEANSSTWTIHLLGSSLCSFLKKLNFNASGIPDDKLIEILRNAPSLTDLTIESCRLSFETLEQLHVDLCYLKVLRLKEMKEVRGSLPLNIASNSKLTSFEVGFEYINEVHAMAMVLQYINGKYTKLERLKLMEPQNKSSNKSTNIWYGKGLYPLIYQRGCLFRELCIDSNGLPGDIFSIMDEAGCRLKRLELTDPIQSDLACSGQLCNIQSLRLSRIDTIDYKVLKAAKKLKTLSLSFIRIDGKRNNMKCIRLDSLLSNCSSQIEVLELAHVRLDLSRSSTEFSSIKRLILESVYIPAGINGNLSKKLPCLQTLKMSHCDLTKNEIILHGINLYSIEITNRRAGNKNVLVKTLGDNVTRWWITHSNDSSYHQRVNYLEVHDSPMHPEGKYYELKDKHVIPMVTLVCESVKNIVVL